MDWGLVMESLVNIQDRHLAGLLGRRTSQAPAVLELGQCDGGRHYHEFVPRPVLTDTNII